jgi:TPP-dependent pyruvate/acetoin dehydrogenase alpha subunit
MVIKADENPESTAIPATNQDGEKVSPLLPEQSLKKLYALMLKCRMVGDRAFSFADKSAQNACCLALGHEAVEVAATMNLLPEDTVTSMHRQCGVNIARGIPLDDLLVPLSVNNNRDPKAASSSAATTEMHVNIVAHTPTFDTQLGIATGAALAYKLLKKPQIVVALIDEASSRARAWNESLQIAAAHKLPVVYVVVSGPVSKNASAQPKKAVDFTRKAERLGVPGIIVDGNDPIAIYRVAHEAIDHARSGGGPTLIDCKTRRWTRGTKGDRKGHTHEYGQEDPISHLERYLAKRGLWSEEWKRSLVAAFVREIDEAVAQEH